MKSINLCSSWSQIFCGARGMEGDEYRLSDWLITSSSHVHKPLFSSRHHLALLLLGCNLLSETLPQRMTQSLLAASWKSNTETLPVSHVGICIYYLIAPTHFCSTTWLLSIIISDASCAENLRLTARSKVNIQH